MGWWLDFSPAVCHNRAQGEAGRPASCEGVSSVVRRFVARFFGGALAAFLLLSPARGAELAELCALGDVQAVCEALEAGERVAGRDERGGPLSTAPSWPGCACRSPRTLRWCGCCSFTVRRRMPRTGRGARPSPYRWRRAAPSPGSRSSCWTSAPTPTARPAAELLCTWRRSAGRPGRSSSFWSAGQTPWPRTARGDPL